MSMVEGDSELLSYLLRITIGLRGPFRIAAVRRATEQAQEYAVQITHRDTGALAGAHEKQVDSVRGEGRVFISRSARNPRVGHTTPVYQYGVYEHDRGGEHAFYERTVEERGDLIGHEGVDLIVESVRNG
ncbi:MAG: hypothetical protein L0219_07360 [Phycisphaerales bacterium]|nr:hypothetical protein [Phycisphaerales bacterium]